MDGYRVEAVESDGRGGFVLRLEALSDLYKELQPNLCYGMGFLVNETGSCMLMDKFCPVFDRGSYRAPKPGDIFKIIGTGI